MNGFIVEAERLIQECGTIHNDFKEEMKEEEKKDAEKGKVELIPKLQAMTECYRNRNYTIIKRLQRQKALISALQEAEQMWIKPLSEIENATNNIRKNAQDERWASFAERREPSFLTDKNRIQSNILEVMNRSRIYRTMLVQNGLVIWLKAMETAEEVVMDNLPCRCLQLKDMSSKMQGYLEIRETKHQRTATSKETGDNAKQQPVTATANNSFKQPLVKATEISSNSKLPPGKATAASNNSKEPSAAATACSGNSKKRPATEIENTSNSKQRPADTTENSVDPKQQSEKTIETTSDHNETEQDVYCYVYEEFSDFQDLA